MILECPHCGRTSEVRFFPQATPAGTTRVITPCSECPDDITLPRYFTETGAPVALPR